VSIITRGLGKGQTYIVKGFTGILKVIVEKLLGVVERLYRRRVKLRVYSSKLAEGVSHLPLVSSISSTGKFGVRVSAALRVEAETSIYQTFPIEDFGLASIPLTSEILATDSGDLYIQAPLRRDESSLLDLRISKRGIDSLSIRYRGPRLRVGSLGLPVNQRKKVVSSRRLKISGERFGSTREAIQDLILDTIILDSLPEDIALLKARPPIGVRREEEALARRLKRIVAEARDQVGRGLDRETVYRDALNQGTLAIQDSFLKIAGIARIRAARTVGVKPQELAAEAEKYLNKSLKKFRRDFNGILRDALKI